MGMKFSVVIPVGPKKRHTVYLPQAIESVMDQNSDILDQILLVNDGDMIREIDFPYGSLFSTFVTGITVGIPAACNLGVIRARNEFVILLGSDDKLLPGCLELCAEAWEQYRDPLGWYYMGVEYSNGETQNTPCAAAMFHKEFFRFTGGFPPESVVGSTDHIFTSVLMAQKGKTWHGDFYRISDKTLYWHRVHENRDTDIRKAQGWMPAIKQVKEQLERTWQPKGFR